MLIERINNPNQHGYYNKPSIELVQKTSLVPTPMDLAICFQPSASMDPIVGYLFTWYYTQHSRKNQSGNSFPPNREYFFIQQENKKKQYKIQFQLENYTSYFSTFPYEPTSSRRAKLCANHMSATMEVRGGSWYLGDIFCSEADMAMQSKTNAGRCGK